ncbi:hypothetical protein AB0L67_18800 [Streptomyces flaveolus]|uniref:hypothetical protein n=1 Tax=Streptomyces flaveolus TaxID=67297 RepID=UPI0034413D61
MGGFNERRSLQELTFMYEAEPELCDIYVEGRTDRVLIEHLLAGAGVRVWEDGDVDVPSELVLAGGNKVGSKGRIAAIARELDRHFADTELKVRCVIDADCDRVIGTTFPGSKHLRYTDFTCVEAYFWDVPHVQKYVKLGLHDTLGQTAEQLIASLNPILRESFLLRAGHLHIGEGWKWIDISSCISAKKGDVSFDRDKWINKYLQANSAWHRRTDFENAVETYRHRLSDDIRTCLHGHDLTKIVAEVVKAGVKPNYLGQVEVVSRMLAMTIERDDAHRFSLLSELFHLAHEGLQRPNIPPQYPTERNREFAQRKGTS